ERIPVGRGPKNQLRGNLHMILSRAEATPEPKEEPNGACEMAPRTNNKPTMRNSEFFLARMRASLIEASETTLPKLREQALRAAAAWQEMYDKALLFEKRQRR